MSFVPRPHQIEADAMMRAELRAGVSRLVLQMPTGAGKTMQAAMMVLGARAKGKRVIFCVPSISLINQTVKKFREMGIEGIGVIQAQHELTDPSHPVQICSIETLKNRPLPPADLVIIDECHRMFEFITDWIHRADWQNVPFIGLSATPWARGMGKDYQSLVVGIGMKKLTERGLLVPYRIFAPSHPDLSKVRTTAGDYNLKDLGKAASQPALVGDAVSTWLKLGEDRPTLCYAVDLAHARRLTDEFNAAGVAAEYVDANTPPAEREAIGERLIAGQIKVAVNVGTLTTGVDWPEVSCISLVRPTKSEMLYVQIVGRGLRPADGKTDCIVLDHSDTTLRLGFPADIHHGELDDGKPRKSGTARVERLAPLPKECKSCAYLKPAGVHKCPVCGFAPERQSGIEERDGDLVALNARGKGRKEPTTHTKQEFWSMLTWEHDLVHNVDIKHPERKKALGRYKGRFGVWPRGLKEWPILPDDEFRRYLKSQAIRWHKGQEKKRRPEIRQGGDDANVS